MSRSTTFIGLSNAALDWLDKNCKKVPTSICKHCGKPNGEALMTESLVDRCGMFDEIDLRSFILKDGSIVKEVIQLEFWDSGPMIYTCLQLEDGTRMCLWPKEALPELVDASQIESRVTKNVE